MKRKLIILLTTIVLIVSAIGLGTVIASSAIKAEENAPASSKKKKEKKTEDKKEDKKEEDKKEEDKKEDPNVEKVTITFNTNGGDKIEAISVTKGMTKELPIPGKSGYTFEGWYLGSTLIDSNYKFESNVTLTAKWTEEIRTMKITFVTNGGSSVSPIIQNCNKGITLPKAPTKTGYIFKYWQDKRGGKVFNGGKIKCQNTILYAQWEKEKVYTCEEGYTLSGTNCTLTMDAKERCPEGFTEKNGVCLNLSSRSEPTIKCAAGELINNKCYVTPLEEDEETCGTNSHVWYEGKCYTKVTDTTKACTSGQMDGDKCYPKKDKEKYCDEEGYELKSGKCVKTVPATEVKE